MWTIFCSDQGRIGQDIFALAEAFHLEGVELEEKDDTADFLDVNLAWNLGTG